MSFHDDLASWLLANQISGPFAFDAYPADTIKRTLIRAESGAPSDRSRQWEFPSYSFVCRATERRTAEEQAMAVHRLFDMAEAYLVGETFVAWSECLGLPRFTGKDPSGFFSYRVDVDFHLTYRAQAPS